MLVNLNINLTKPSNIDSITAKFKYSMKPEFYVGRYQITLPSGSGTPLLKITPHRRLPLEVKILIFVSIEIWVALLLALPILGR